MSERTDRMAKTKKKQVEERQEKWLAAFAEAGTITDACKVTGVGRSTVHRWREDAGFRAKFVEADEESIESLELEARKRALARSDVLLIFLLKAKRPEIYRDRFEGRMTHDVDARVVNVSSDTMAHMTDEELESARESIKKLLGVGE